MNEHYRIKRRGAVFGSHRLLAAIVLALLASALLGGWLRGPAMAEAGGGVRPLNVAAATQTVALDMSDETIARLRRQLAEAGKTLSESDDGLVAVTVKPGPKRTPDKEPQVLPVPAPLPPGQKPMIAVVIDDLGLVRDRTLATIALPAPLTLAFLPYANGVDALAQAGKAAGHELLVHMPMEPASTRTDPGPDALLTSLDAAEINARIERNLARFDGFVGINNHMGSRFTQSADGMALVLSALRARGLFFLDSRTTGASAARREAVSLNVPYAERDVFLDNHQEAPYLALQLREVETLARRNGSAIAIGHPHAVTVAALKVWLETLEAKGFELVPVSRIVEQRETPLWRLAQNRKGNRG